MSNERTRDRGNLFENVQKKKPSQPDFQGDCTIDSVAYEIRGWRREEQLAVSLAPPRGDRNTYPPEVFRGAFEAVPARPTRAGARGTEGPQVPAWTGDISSEDAAYTVRAFEKQGKAGLYFTLTFERLATPAPRAASALLEPSDDDD
jgi:hypothetical protein